MGSVVEAPGLSSTNSIVVVQELSCSCGIFLGQGLKLVSPALAGRFFTTEPPGRPLKYDLLQSKSFEF